MEPTGPAFGRPDDKLRAIRKQRRRKEKPTPHYASLHAGYCRLAWDVCTPSSTLRFTLAKERKVGIGKNT